MKENKKEKVGIKVILLCLCFFVTIGLLICFSKPKIKEKDQESTTEELVAKEPPKVSFEGNISNMETKSDVRKIKLKYESKDLNFEAYTTIKIQGTSSLTYDKKNYTITLFEDENYENKMNVDVGFGLASKYCLKANWIDKTHARNIVTARLARAIQRKYNLFLDTPNNGVIDGFPIEVYSNGEFLGLYTWNIPKDAWMFQMDENNENHIVLSNEGWEAGSMFTSLATYQDWSIEVGNEDQETLKKFNRMVGFVKNSTDKLFKSEFSNYIDLDSAIHYYIMLEFAELPDNAGKNMLMATYDGNIWYPTLYDLDTSWGTNYTGSGTYDYTLMDIASNSNLWKRLKENFSEEIKVRYFELRESILTKENILKEFEDFENSIPQKIFEREKEKWGMDLPGYDLEQIKEFLDIRIPLVDEFMNNL